MKKQVVLLTLCLTCISLITIVSCKKSNTPSTPAKTPEQLITANPWKVYQEKGIFGTDSISYLRGGTTNTQSLDNESILFNIDSTGVYTANDGTQSSLTWNFTNTQKTNLTWTVQFIPATTITWNILILKTDSLKYNESFTQSNENENATILRIPK